MEAITSSIPAPTQARLDTQLRYCEEEIEGEAYIAALADLAEQPDHRDKLNSKARVERHAASIALPLVRKHTPTPGSAAILPRTGQDQARVVAKSSSDLLAEMAQRCSGYVDDFLRLDAMAAPGDLQGLKLLTAHETAAIAFLDLEMSGEPGRVGSMNIHTEKDIA